MESERLAAMRAALARMEVRRMAGAAHATEAAHSYARIAGTGIRRESGNRTMGRSAQTAS